MIKNQYILSRHELTRIPDNFRELKLDEFHIYVDESLDSFQAEFNHQKLVLLGFIIDPMNPQLSNQEIANYLVKIVTKESLFQTLDEYSGRYLILFASKNDKVLLSDMFGQRQINYTQIGNEFYFSSSVKLLLDITEQDIRFIPEYEKLKNDAGFQMFDQWFLGDLTWSEQVKKVLPNHYVDLNTDSIQRLPFHQMPKLNEDEVIRKTIQIVNGNYEAVLIRYETVFQALTSGYDSRTLLALSSKFWPKIQFYTFYRGDTNSARDSKIAKKLSEEFSFPYKRISRLAKDENFENFYKSNFIIPRTTPKFYNILFFQNYSIQKTINITGDGVQMVRNLRDPKSLETAESLFESLGFGMHEFHLDSFRKWLNGAKDYCKEHEILISDLFTQEIAQGQLTARWSHEFDLSGCEEFNPFSHKKLIYSILKNIPYEKRISPDYTFQKDLMEGSFANISKIDFNPPTWKDQIKKIIKLLTP